MNVLIYAKDVKKSSGGIFQYTQALLYELKDRSIDYYVYLNKDDYDFNEDIINSKNFIIVDSTQYNITRRANILNRISNYLLRKISLKPRIKLSSLEKYCLSNKINVIHCPYQFYYESNVVKFITTMHDVQELHFPELFSSEEREFRSTYYRNAIEKSDKVIVSYEHIKNDLLKFFEISENQIEVVLMNMQHLIPNNIQDIEFDKFQFPFEDFVLYPAATWAHKNHILLFQAISILKHKGIYINLVCTGKKTNYYENLNIALKKLNLEKQVVFLDVVDESELFSLYKKCKAVVIPTLYEAGSFPLYEAMLLEIPVICSNVTSLPETIGNDEFTFNPFDEIDLANKLQKIYCDENFRLRNKLNSDFRNKSFNKQNFADVLETIYTTL